MEGKKVHPRKGSNRPLEASLESGMPETETPSKGVRFSLVMR